MILKILTPKNLEQMAQMLRPEACLLPMGSQTSTVIPFHIQYELTRNGVSCLLDTSCLEKDIEFLNDQSVRVSGAVNWKELRAKLHSCGREVGCWPTDETALVLSGVATSATGERCFSRGTLRDHVISLEYMNGCGEIEALSSGKKLEITPNKYRELLSNYTELKNPPFPYFEKETDLQVGLEGQLGVITSVVLKTFSLNKTTFVLCPFYSWLECGFDYGLIGRLRNHRDKILSFEFIDQRSIDISKNDQLENGKDYYILEVVDEFIDEVLKLLEDCEVETENCIVMDEKKFSNLRVDIPRQVNEYIASNGLLKMGTDSQSTLIDFPKLVEVYKKLAKKGEEFVLFGHLGDCHLHFNFLPKKESQDLVAGYLDEYYREIKELAVTPFAEHGIGIIKQKFMHLFYNDTVKYAFHTIKEKYDPENKFFPQGFLNFEKEVAHKG